MSYVVCLAVPCSSILSLKPYHFQKKLLNIEMRVLIFCTVLSETFLILEKSSARYSRKCTLGFMQRALYSCQILVKLEFSGQIFEKCSNIEFHEKPSSGNRLVSMWMG